MNITPRQMFYTILMTVKTRTHMQLARLAIQQLSVDRYVAVLACNLW